MPNENLSTDSEKKGTYKDLEDKIEEIHDLEIVNKLDIINLKSEIDKLRLGGVTVTEPLIEQKSEVVLCRKCGAVLPAIAKYCGKCGEKVKQ